MNPLVSLLVHSRSGSRDEAARAGAQAAEAAGAVATEVVHAGADASPGTPRAAAWNAAAREAHGTLVALLHADSTFEPGWLTPLVEAASGPAAAARGGGIAGSRLLDARGAVTDGYLLAYARPYPLTVVGQADTGALAGTRGPLEVPAVGSASMVLPAALLAALGGFDEGYAAGLEDVDLCLRAGLAGHPVSVVRGSRVRHAGACAPRRDGPDPDAIRLSRSWLGRVPLLDADGLRRAKAGPPRPGRPPLSLVVPARDAALALPRTGEVLLAALGPSDELVLADGGSTDGTREWAELLARDAPATVRVVTADGLEAAAAAGLAAATRGWGAVLHPGGPAAAGLLDDATQALQLKPDCTVLALGSPAGTTAFGPVEHLRRLPPASFLAADPGALEASAGGTAYVIR